MGKIKIADLKVSPISGTFIYDENEVSGALWCESDGVFLLSNDRRKNGCDAKNKHGWKYSYVHWVNSRDTEFDLARVPFTISSTHTKRTKLGVNPSLEFRKVKRFTL